MSTVAVHEGKLLGDCVFPEDIIRLRHRGTQHEKALVTSLEFLPTDPATLELIRDSLPAGASLSEYERTLGATERDELVWIADRTGAVEAVTGSPHWALLHAALRGWSAGDGTTSKHSCLIPAHLGCRLDAAGQPTGPPIPKPEEVGVRARIDRQGPPNRREILQYVTSFTRTFTVDMAAGTDRHPEVSCSLAGVDSATAQYYKRFIFHGPIYERANPLWAERGAWKGDVAQAVVRDVMGGHNVAGEIRDGHKVVDFIREKLPAIRMPRARFHEQHRDGSN